MFAYRNCYDAGAFKSAMRRDELAILLCRSFWNNIIVSNGMINLVEANSPIYSYRFREPKRVEDVVNENLWKKDVTTQSNIHT